MLFCFGLFALLLYNTVVANAECSYTYLNSSQLIEAVSVAGYYRCVYNIQAPGNYQVKLNFTHIYGFQVGPDTGWEDEGDYLTIYQATRQAGNSTMTGDNWTALGVTGPSDQPPARSSTVRFAGRHPWQEGDIPTKAADLNSNNKVDAKISGGQIAPSDSDWQGTKLETGRLPEVEVRELLAGKETVFKVISQQNNNHQPPQVLQTRSHLIRIVYTWGSHLHSGFTLHFDFIHNLSQCEESLAQAEETSFTVPISDSVDLVRMLVLSVCLMALVLVGIVVCVVSQTHCHRLFGRLQGCSGGHSSRPNPPQSPSSEALASSPAQEHLDQRVALLRDHGPIWAQGDVEIGLPPQIPLSKDGEESYAQSQRHLALAYMQHLASQQELFRPPPNRTVHDRMSPPPYSPAHSCKCSPPPYSLCASRSSSLIDLLEVPASIWQCQTRGQYCRTLPVFPRVGQAVSVSDPIIGPRSGTLSDTSTMIGHLSAAAFVPDTLLEKAGDSVPVSSTVVKGREVGHAEKLVPVSGNLIEHAEGMVTRIGHTEVLASIGHTAATSSTSSAPVMVISSPAAGDATAPKSSAAIGHLAARASMSKDVIRHRAETPPKPNCPVGHVAATAPILGTTVVHNGTLGRTPPPYGCGSAQLDGTI